MVSESDSCVMRRCINGMIFIILIYVDDLLILAMKDEIEGICELLTGVFMAITMEIGRELLYLGMQVVWWDGSFEITMDYYLEQLVKD